MALLISAVPMVHAQATPTLYFTDPTLTVGGSSVYCYLRMNNAENISAMEYRILYDAENIELESINNTGFTNNTDVTVSINDNEQGIIHVSLVSLNGFNGSAYLNLMYFKAKEDAKPGVYPISVLVTDIYNSSFETVVANTQAGTITIREATQIVKNISFSNSVSLSSLTVGETVDYKLSASNLNNLSAGSFEFTYDDTKLKFNGATLSSAIQNTVCDINGSIDGLVKMSFASEKAITSGTNLITLNFSAIAPGTASIRFKPIDLYDFNFFEMTGNELEKSVSIKEPEVVVDYPDLRVTVPQNIFSDKEFVVQAVLEGGSNVSAGEFTISYDCKALECLDIKAEPVNGIIVVNEKFSDGQAEFLVISDGGLVDDAILVSITFKSIENLDSKSNISISGSGVYDNSYNNNPVTLEYIGAQVNIIRPEYTVNFYDSDGETLLFSQKVMSGNSAIPPKTEEIRKSDKENHLKFSGWDKDYSVISDNTDITAVYQNEEHTEIITPGIAPGYDTPGYSDGVYCDVCGDVIKEPEEIKPLGTVISAVLDSDGNLKVYGALSDSTSTDGTTYVAVYDKNERMIMIKDITSLNQSDFEIELEGCHNARSIKIMRWDMDSLKPFQDSYRVDVDVKYPFIDAELTTEGVLRIFGALSDNTSSEGTTYVAVYNSFGKMINITDITADNHAELDIELTNCKTADKVKILRWNIDTLTPYVNAIEIDLK